MIAQNIARIDCRGLRLLLVGSYPPPFGGIATHLVALIPGLRERGAEDIAVASMGEAEGTEDIPGAKLYRLYLKNHARLLLRPRNWPMVARIFASLSGMGLKKEEIVREAVKAVLVESIARRHRSDVVAFYHSNAHFEIVPLAKHWRGKRGVVLTVFGEVYGDATFMKGHRKLIEAVLAAPGAVWASSAHCARSFTTLGIKRHIEPIFIGVDLAPADTPALRAHFRLEAGLAESDVVVLFMGRFISDMGLDVLLDVIGEMLAAGSRLKFILAGAKGHLSGDVSQLRDRFPEGVLVYENVPFSKQASLYASCDLLVAPSFDQRACMGLSIKEAMAASLPVIATESGGIPEAVVHGETGYLVPLDEVTRAANRHLLKSHIETLAADPALRAKLGAAGRGRAETLFASERTIDRVGALLMGVRPRAKKA